MPRKSISTRKPATKSRAAYRTPVRNTSVPKARSARRETTREQIARRAYEIWLSGNGGTEQENWLRAERELNK